MSATEASLVAGVGPEVLACHGRWQVHRCPTGCLHVRFGAATLQMGREEFEGFLAVLIEAGARLEIRDAFARLGTSDVPC